MFTKIVLTLAALGTMACGGKQSAYTNPAAPVGAAVESIVTGSFVVEPRTFKPFKLVVTPAMSNARVEGTFTASGARNDIEVTVLEENQFLNWQNGHKFLATYESGRVTAGKLHIELPEAACYYIVFSNRFSMLSNKAVVADVRLTYDRAGATHP